MPIKSTPDRKVVAVLLDTLRSEDRDCLRGIAGFADSRPDWDFHIEERQVGDLEHLPIRKIDAVIVRLRNPTLLKPILSKRIPAINLSGSEAISKIPRVCNDNDAIGVMAAEYFLARGYRELAVFGHLHHHGISQRMSAFERTCGDRGVHCRRFLEDDESIKEFLEWADESATPVAVLSCTSYFARNLLHIAHKANVPIPEKVAVLGVTDDDLICGFATPRLSSVRCNSYRIGYASAVLLSRLLDGEAVDPETSIAPMGVVTRRSTDMLAVSDPNIVEALKFIRDNYNRPITCDEVAEVSHLNRRTLDRRFASVLGRSVTEEIRRVRIQSAKRLLVNTEDTLAMIADNCGFDYPERFSVVFKRMEGTTPSGYRQRFRG